MAARMLQPSEETSIAALWRRGILSWKLRPEQKMLLKAIEESEVQLSVFEITRRLGKTFTLLTYACQESIKTRQKIRYGCSFRDDLEQFVIPIMETILVDVPEDLRPQFLKTDSKYIWGNGSEIKLVGIDKNPQGMRGNAIAKMIFDEAGYVKNLKTVYTSVVIPATMKQPDIKLLFASSTPEDEDHYFDILAAKSRAQKNGYYCRMTIDDISDLDPRERQRILDEVGGEFSVEAQREFFCNRVRNPESVAIPEYTDAIVVDFAMPSHFKSWIGGDAGGVRDKTALLFMAFDFERAKILIFDEVVYDKHTKSEIILDEAKAKEKEWKIKPPRHVDLPGQLQIDWMNTYKYPCSLPTKTEFEVSINWVRSHMNKIEIHSRCVETAKTLKYAKLNKNRTDFERTEALGHADCLMALCYGLRYVNRANPFSSLAEGTHAGSHYVPPGYTQERSSKQSANTLKSLFKV